MQKYEISPNNCAARLDLTDRKAVIKNMAGRIAGSLNSSEKTVQEALAKRESAGSTGLENGIALPHHCATPIILVAELVPSPLSRHGLRELEV